VVLCAFISLLPVKVIAEPLYIKYQDIRVYAFEKVLQTWGSEQWFFFEDLIERESQWKNTAQNPNSTAYGIGQFLRSTWEIVGCEKTDNAEIQVDCTIRYVSKRYSTPEKAIDFHNKNNFY
jgi:hypothetical protein